jgi:hypothetical protein
MNVRMPHHGIATIALLLSGCTTIEFGNQPDTDRLDSLEIGVATQTDVLLALGQPRGEGAAEFNPQPGRPRRIWFYEYMRAENKDLDLTILIVLFEDDLYDGYWWFSSTEQYQWEKNTAP